MARKSTSKKKATKRKSTKKKAARRATRRASPEDFFADTEVLSGNARTKSQRKRTRTAALTEWDDEDIRAIERNERGQTWGWDLHVY